MYKTHSLDDDGWTEWINPGIPYKMRCCDCGLVHNLEFNIDKGRVLFRARRNMRATSASRSKRNGIDE